LFVGYCFGEIMCIWDSYVYQKGVLCFLIHKSYVRSIKRYCFVRKYAAIPVHLLLLLLLLYFRNMVFGLTKEGSWMNVLK